MSEYILKRLVWTAKGDIIGFVKSTRGERISFAGIRLGAYRDGGVHGRAVRT